MCFLRRPRHRAAFPRPSWKKSPWGKVLKPLTKYYPALRYYPVLTGLPSNIIDTLSRGVPAVKKENLLRGWIFNFPEQFHVILAHCLPWTLYPHLLSSWVCLAGGLTSCHELSWALLVLLFTDTPLKHFLFMVYEDTVVQRIMFEAKNNQKSKARQCHMGSAHLCAGILWWLVLLWLNAQLNAKLTIKIVDTVLGNTWVLKSRTGMWWGCWQAETQQKLSFCSPCLLSGLTPTTQNFVGSELWFKAAPTKPL